MNESSPVNAFEVFGPAHVLTMAIIAVASVALPLAARLVNRKSLTRGICWTLVALLIGSETIHYVDVVVREGWRSLIEEALPLHFCGLSIYLTSYALISRRQFVYELIYFWGLGAAAMAIITPAVDVDFPDLAFITFFVGHGAIVVGACFATFALGMRPTLRGLWTVIPFSIGTVCAVGFANWLLGSNYMFLCRPPVSASPNFFLPWPGYILFNTLVAIGIFHLLWLPFGIARKMSSGQHGR